MDISFCTTCRNRLADLQQTLLCNLELLRDGEEIVLLDYNSTQDDVLGWVNTVCHEAVTAKKLRYFREHTAVRFFMAHAKNVAHLLGTGKKLVNLDADNYLDANYLHEVRSDWGNTVMLFPHKGSGGFKGRVAINAIGFRTLGGYNEQLYHGYGYDDIDLYRRLKATKGAIKHIEIAPDKVIPTPNELRMAGQLNRDESIFDSSARHRKICETNLRNGQYIANLHCAWGVATVTDSDGCVYQMGMMSDIEQLTG